MAVLLPHWEQKAALGASVAPQVQVLGSGLPHSGQKREPTEIFAPQCGQPGVREAPQEGQKRPSASQTLPHLGQARDEDGSGAADEWGAVEEEEEGCCGDEGVGEDERNCPI